ncbi:MAG: PSD1 domain-containing protein [Planctomycetaceae bacterium]|nr:PSD1 domain-containing protein [Planctomycetaceae bacterium]
MIRNAQKFLLCLLAIVTAGELLHAEEVNFNRDIRPVLSENCFYCHGQDPNKREADLRLDVRSAAIEYGAIVPGNLSDSLLVERINSKDADLMMPPADSNRQLTVEQKELLELWINQGAKFESHWAYETPTRPAQPETKDKQWARNAVDHFVLNKLEAEGIAPSPEADRVTLIKRLSIDLIGLPPTRQEVDAFVADTDPQAYEKLVDRLLSSKHYGERMALPWLDAARYADSNGFQQDGDTWQWIWRDWVVRALNEDLPFDQFTIWQLAGDLLPDATIDQKIASGFNRNHLLNGEGGAIAEEQRFVILFDRIDTTATTWLSLTMACAQCHDHKYDPITRQDYYSLLDAFNRVPESGKPQRQSSRIRVAAPFIELPTDENKTRIADWESQIAKARGESAKVTNAAYAGWHRGVFSDSQQDDVKGLPEPLIAILKKMESDRSDIEKKSLEDGLRKHFDQKVLSTIAGKLPEIGKLNSLNQQLANYRGDQIPRVMVMSDAKPRETFILDRGEYLKPLDKVSFATPKFLPPLPDGAPANRLGFAQWLVSPDHPLTSRVQANRMWGYFFGTGIVKTSEDMGVQSEYPIHKDLLDWLAVEFREGGWSVKKMHRLLVTSATYRQTSRVTPQLLKQDSENTLYARAARFRMPSAVLRDWALASSNLLEKQIGGKPVYPYQPENVWEALAITKERDFTYPKSSGKDLYRRSLYTFWRRTVSPANMFDASNRQACRVRHSITSTPLHALTTLNDPTWVEAARVLARLSMQDSKTLNTRIEFAFCQVLCRVPTESDKNHLRRAYENQLAIYKADNKAAIALLNVGETPRDESLNASEHAALTVVCLGILNLDEALTRE